MIANVGSAVFFGAATIIGETLGTYFGCLMLHCVLGISTVSSLWYFSRGGWVPKTIFCQIKYQKMN